MAGKRGGNAPQPPLIRKAQETATGGAKTYKIGNVEKTRATTVREVNKGLHEGYHVVNVNGTDFVRSDPDGTVRDNVDYKP